MILTSRPYTVSYTNSGFTSRVDPANINYSAGITNQSGTHTFTSTSSRTLNGGTIDNFTDSSSAFESQATDTFTTDGYSDNLSRTSSSQSVRVFFVSRFNNVTEGNTLSNNTVGTFSSANDHGSRVQSARKETSQRNTVREGGDSYGESTSYTNDTTRYTTEFDDRYLSESFTINTESISNSGTITRSGKIELATFNIVTTTGEEPTNTGTTRSNFGTVTRTNRASNSFWRTNSGRSSTIEVRSNLTSASTFRSFTFKSQVMGANGFTRYTVNGEGNVDESTGGTSTVNTTSSSFSTSFSSTFNSSPTIYYSRTTTTTTRNTVSHTTASTTLTSTVFNESLSDSNSAFTYTYVSPTFGGTTQEITIPTTTNDTYESRVFHDDKAWTNISYYFGGNNGGFVKLQDIPNNTSKFDIPFNDLEDSTSHPINYFPRSDNTYSYSYNNIARITRPIVTANSSATQRTVTGFPTVERTIYTETDVIITGSFSFNQVNVITKLYTSKTRQAAEWDNPTSTVSTFTTNISSTQNGTDSNWTSVGIETLSTQLSTKTCYSFSNETFSASSQYQRLVTTNKIYIGIGTSNDNESSVSITRVNTFRDNQISFRSYGVRGDVLIATLRDELGTGLGFQSAKTNFTEVTGPPRVSFSDEILTTGTVLNEFPTTTSTFYNTTTSSGSTTTSTAVVSSTKTESSSVATGNVVTSTSYEFFTNLDKSYKNNRDYIYSPEQDMPPFEANATSFSSVGNSIHVTFTLTDFYFSGNTSFTYSTLLFGLREVDNPDGISTFSYPENLAVGTGSGGFRGGQNIIDEKGTVLVTGDDTVSNLNPSIFTDTGSNDYISFNLDNSICQSKTIAKHRICRLAQTHALIKDYEDFGGGNEAFIQVYKSNVQ